MAANENQIVVYQPNETVRLDVRLENETVWLTQSQMATLFGCSTDNIGLHLKNVFAVGELSREATTEDFSVVRKEVMSSLRRRQDGRRNHLRDFSPQSARRQQKVLPIQRTNPPHQEVGVRDGWKIGKNGIILSWK